MNSTRPEPDRAAPRDTQSGRKRSRWLTLIAFAVLIPGFFAVGGCSSGAYLAHVSWGQLGVILERERLTPERIAALDPEERERLELILQAREFGTSLGLSRSSSYRHLSERDDDTAVRVVVAAPPDRLEPVSWWFPLVGSVTYRGYFDPARADKFAAKLGSKGLDTYVRPAMLYSTLGWFDDPIPRGVLSWSAADVVDVGIHELVHETLYVPSDTAYNEALATFIAKEASLLFFRDDPERTRLANQIFSDRVQFAVLLDRLTEDLDAFYAAATSEDEAIAGREEIFQRYQGQYFDALTWQTERYSRFPTQTLNNAWVVAQTTYLGELGCFAAWYESLGGGLEALIDAVMEHPGEVPLDLEACGPA